jgi:streptomycin 6-kinase
MLKIATDPEERWGSGLMLWWNGVGVARVIEHDEDAVLLERATGSRSLADMSEHGADDEASLIICNVVSGLHARRVSPPPDLIPLTHWFQAPKPLPVVEYSLGAPKQRARFSPIPAMSFRFMVISTMRTFLISGTGVGSPLIQSG